MWLTRVADGVRGTPVTGEANSVQRQQGAARAVRDHRGRKKGLAPDPRADSLEVADRSTSIIGKASDPKGSPLRPASQRISRMSPRVASELETMCGGARRHHKRAGSDH